MGFVQTMAKVNGAILITKWLEDLRHFRKTKLNRNWIPSEIIKSKLIVKWNIHLEKQASSYEQFKVQRPFYVPLA